MTPEIMDLYKQFEVAAAKAKKATDAAADAKERWKAADAAETVAIKKQRNARDALNAAITDTVMRSADDSG